MTLGRYQNELEEQKRQPRAINCFKGETKMPGNKYTSEKLIQP